MIQQQPEPQPYFIELKPKAAPKGDLGKLLVGSFGLTGALVLGAIASGTLLAGLWIFWRKIRRTYESDAPPSIGSVAIGVSSPPSDQDRSAS